MIAASVCVLRISAGPAINETVPEPFANELLAPTLSSIARWSNLSSQNALSMVPCGLTDWTNRFPCTSPKARTDDLTYLLVHGAYEVLDHCEPYSFISI